MSRLITTCLLLCIIAICGCLPRIVNIDKDILSWQGEWMPARYEEVLFSTPIMIRGANSERAIVVDKSMLNINVINKKMALHGAGCVIYDGVMGISAPSYMAQGLIAKYRNAQSAHLYGQAIDVETAIMLSSMPRLKYIAIDTTYTDDTLSEEVMLILGKSQSLVGIFFNTESEKVYCSYKLVKCNNLYPLCKFLPLKFESCMELQTYLDIVRPEFCDVLVENFTTTICVPDCVRSYRMQTTSSERFAFADITLCCNLDSLSILGDCGYANSCQELVLGLSKCDALRVLAIKTNYFTNNIRGVLDMTEVGSLKRLRVLSLEGVTIADWKFCQSCDNLEEIYLGDMSASGNGAAFKMLRKVIAYDSTLSASFLGSATECPIFEELELANVSISGEVQLLSLSSKFHTFLMVECDVNAEAGSFMRLVVSETKSDMVIECYACKFYEDEWAAIINLSSPKISPKLFCVYCPVNRFYKEKVSVIREDEYYEILENYRRILPAYQSLYWTAASRLERVLSYWRLSLSLDE